MTEPVQIVGGGIAGLSAALTLQDAGVDYELHEASSTFGGKISSSEVDGVTVDAGADNFVTRDSNFLALIERVGLKDHLIHPVSANPPFVYVDGELHPLPGGTYIGIPKDDLGSSFSPVTQTYLTPPTELANTEPVSVGDVIRAEFTAEVADLLVNPLLGGVNATSIDSLDFEASMPSLYEEYKRTGSLAKVAAQIPKSTGGKVFAGLATTTQGLIDGLAAQLDPQRLFTNSSVNQLSNQPTILATPAIAAKNLFDGAKLQIEFPIVNYTSVAQVTVTFDTNAIDLPDSSGIIFPTTEGKHLSASTFLSSKWQHYKDSGKAIVRLTTGKQDSGWDLSSVNDEQLIKTLIGEIAEVIKFDSYRETRVVRWDNALPHYEVGHASKIRELRKDMHMAAPHIQLAGAAYDGIGIPACWQSGVNATNAFCH